MVSLIATGLRTEYEENPLGIGSRRPRLFWTLRGQGRAERQSAYRIIVASNPEALEREEADRWDSGRVGSDRNTHVLYEGPEARSAECLWWKVRIWDQDGIASPWSAPAWWETGLLAPEDWMAAWIGRGTGPRHLSWRGAQWIRRPDQPEDKAETHIRFRHTARVPADRGIGRAWLLAAMQGTGSFRINGQLAGEAAGARTPLVADVTALIVPGDNRLEVNLGGVRPRLAARLRVELTDGSLWDVDTGAGWQVAVGEGAPWVDAAAEAWDPAARIRSGNWSVRQGEHGWDPLVRPGPAPHMRRSFAVAGAVARARIYATALGVYALRCNGHPVGDQVLAPGWTDYHYRAQVQTYDVTNLLVPGENVLGAILGSGWYCGRIAAGTYGDEPALRVQLRIDYADGRSETIASGPDWRGATGPILTSDIYDGEVYDARLELGAWDRPGFDDGAWDPVGCIEAPALALEAQVGPPVVVTEELVPVSVTEVRPGVAVFDMGQNMVGWVRLRVKGEAGTEVRLRFAEVLSPDGTIYTAGLRRAMQTDVYRLRGEPGGEVFEPHFTFHGFRYVEVTGYPGIPDLGAITGRVIHSDAPRTGRLVTSDARVNRLESNILWSQRGNFVSVPTDCPQRDERLGWTGDALIFIPTACFHMDVASFFTKWLIDLNDGQQPSGAYPHVAPYLSLLGAGSAAWGDAGVFVPWTLWQRYGDRALIERYFVPMCRWVDYLRENTTGLIRPAQGYGDWLNLQDDTPKDLVSTAYFAFSAHLLSRMAAVIGREADARAYGTLYREVADAFCRAYVRDDGQVGTGSQTGYVLALHFGLLPTALRPLAARHLVAAIEARDWHLSTGFVGTAYLLPVLSENGYHDVAVKLLSTDSFPSWLYEVVHGATTMWERWDGWTEARGFQDAGMNSFNHYAYGAVGDWLVRYLAGIELDAGSPSGRHWVIRPRPGDGIDRVAASYRSIQGTVACAWSREGGTLRLEVEIPANTTATVFVPSAEGPEAVREGIRPAVGAEGVTLAGQQGEAAVFTVGSGRYVFTV